MDGGDSEAPGEGSASTRYDVFVANAAIATDIYRRCVEASEKPLPQMRRAFSARHPYQFEKPRLFRRALITVTDAELFGSDMATARLALRAFERSGSTANEAFERFLACFAFAVFRRAVFYKTRLLEVTAGTPPSRLFKAYARDIEPYRDNDPLLTGVPSLTQCRRRYYTAMDSEYAGLAALRADIERATASDEALSAFIHQPWSGKTHLGRLSDPDALRAKLDATIGPMAATLRETRKWRNDRGRLRVAIFGLYAAVLIGAANLWLSLPTTIADARSRYETCRPLGPWTVLWQQMRAPGRPCRPAADP